MSAEIIITHLRSIQDDRVLQSIPRTSSFMRDAPFLRNAKSTGGVAVIYFRSNLVYTVIIQL